MPLEDDVSSFIVWATKLGFPLENLPNEEALTTIFKSRARDLFIGLTEKVQPKNEVIEIRRNALYKKMEKLKAQEVVPACIRNFLPKEMQRYLKMEDLKKRKASIEMRIQEYTSEYDSLASSIKTKNMQIIKLKHTHETFRARTNLLEMKRDSLSKNIEVEKSNKEKILSAMPVKLRAENANEANALKVISTALQELDAFYNVCLSNSNNQEAKEELWRRLRDTFGKIPNFIIFNTILKLKEQQLENIMTLNKTHMKNNKKSKAKPSLSTFQIQVLRSKEALLEIIAKYLAAKQEGESLNRKFSDAYTQFVDAVQCKVSLCNSETGNDVDEIISNYIVQYNTRSFNKGQNEFLVNEIEACKAEILQRTKLLENHSILLGSIKKIYAEIDASVNRIQYEVMQLGQIKDKILYIKKLQMHMLSDAPVQNKFATTKVKGHNSVGDSFEMITDNVLSSTKVDFDCTINSTMMSRPGADVSFIMPMARSILPTYVTEIAAFQDTPIEKFSCVSKECSFYLQPNPLIIESEELSSTIQLSPGLLQTPYGAILDVQNLSEWSEKNQRVATELKCDVDLIEVDPTVFNRKIKHQFDELTEFSDKIDITAINTNRALRKASTYYKFLLNNPLRKYIPSSKLFNNQSYNDYESEYLMYYRMATVGVSIK